MVPPVGGVVVAPAGGTPSGMVAAVPQYVHSGTEQVAAGSPFQSAGLMGGGTGRWQVQPGAAQPDCGGLTGRAAGSAPRPGPGGGVTRGWPGFRGAGRAGVAGAAALRSASCRSRSCRSI